MADYVGVLTDLKARRAAIDQERADLDAVIAGVERIIARTASQPAARVVTASVPSTLALSAMPRPSMPEALKAYFEGLEVRQPMSTKQVVFGVIAYGVSGKGKNLRGHVYNTLHRLSQDPDGLFVHHADGRWSLRSWSTRVGESVPRGIDLIGDLIAKQR
jgi:hypothetical protein